ncbi:hypothetical protein FXO38_05301 [Capsicum annuum]|nr:hypothetical protein FXO37_19287 [Capsicum annuum]KAF3674308.1 hypothetical protein FXO38_05301 [Capsicum annuum]
MLSLSQKASAATPLSPPFSSPTSPIPASPATNQMTSVTIRLNHRRNLRRHQQRRTNPAPPLALSISHPPAFSATSQRRPSSTPEATTLCSPNKFLIMPSCVVPLRMKPNYSWIYQRNIDNRMGDAEIEDADDEL